MKFRYNISTRIISLLTGLVFLNMSFFMAEVAALKLQKDSELLQNIVKLISFAGVEEEKDAASEPGDTTKNFKGIDICLLGELNANRNPKNKSIGKFAEYLTAELSSGNSDTITQPPES